MGNLPDAFTVVLGGWRDVHMNSLGTFRYASELHASGEQCERSKAANTAERRCRQPATEASGFERHARRGMSPQQKQCCDYAVDHERIRGTNEAAAERWDVHAPYRNVSNRGI
jgi:hypothetical protein